MDDDGLLCAPKLLAELANRPRSKFFHGKYHCRGVSYSAWRPDYNFMLFSVDLVYVVLMMFAGPAGPVFAYGTTWKGTDLGWNLGYYLHFMNVTVFDDRSRIDSQQV